MGNEFVRQPEEMTPAEALDRLRESFKNKGLFNTQLRIIYGNKEYRLSCTEDQFLAYRINENCGVSPGVPGWPVCLVSKERLFDESQMSDFLSSNLRVQDWLDIINNDDFDLRSIVFLPGQHDSDLEPGGVSLQEVSMNIFVSGSLAYDRIMDFPGRFSDHILPDKIHILNVSFTVNGMTEKFGGTAGNIAYALSLLGEKPIILATIGRDYQAYFDWLRKNHISTDSIRIIESEFTASAYITTDLADNQITGFNPGAMKCPSLFDFADLSLEKSIAVVAPGNLEDMMNYPRVFKSRGIDYIFDPGQSLPAWGGEALRESIDGSKILISNDYELELILNKTGLTKAELLKLTEVIITTKGEQGSVVCTADGETDIPAIKVKKLVDPTGAGDAYRGGLIKGLVEGRDIKYCAMMGTVCASFAIECHGTQEYRFTLQEFWERFREHFG